MGWAAKEASSPDRVSWRGLGSLGLSEVVAQVVSTSASRSSAWLRSRNTCRRPTDSSSMTAMLMFHMRSVSTCTPAS